MEAFRSVIHLQTDPVLLCCVASAGAMVAGCFNRHRNLMRYRRRPSLSATTRIHIYVRVIHCCCGGFLGLAANVGMVELKFSISVHS